MKKTLFGCVTALFFLSCVHDDALERALELAGSNRCQLEIVLDHYRDSTEQYAAARFLVENMPAHYSYCGNDIDAYYDQAWQIIQNQSLTPENQRDSLVKLTDSLYRNLPQCTVPDVQVITAQYLIDNIDRSYRDWKERPWCRHVRFDEWLEWMLPYKAVELQSLDAWRDTMLTRFCYGLDNPIKNDVECGTVTATADLLRRQTLETINRYGLYDRSGLPLLSARLLSHMTFGDIWDYVVLSTLTMRSAGIPAVIDCTPVGPRFTAASIWFSILDDKGMERQSEWDLSTQTGWSFFPYERGPKVFRHTYAINPRRQEYLEKSNLKLPFELAYVDVTDRYFLTSNLSVPIDKETRRQLSDKYIYIAAAVTDGVNAHWQIVDFGCIRNGRAVFESMGRECMYRVLGYHKNDIDSISENGLVAVSDPFILEKNGSLTFIPVDSLNPALFRQWGNKEVPSTKPELLWTEP